MSASTAVVAVNAVVVRRLDLRAGGPPAPVPVEERAALPPVG